MKYIRPLLLKVFILISFNLWSQKKVEIVSNQIEREENITIDKFYFQHQIFADAFFMTTLNKVLSTEDIKKAVNELYQNLLRKENVEMKVPINDTCYAFFNFSTKGTLSSGISLIMRTNFIQSTKTYTNKLNDENCFVRIYFLRQGRLVYRKDVYSKEEEEKRKQKSNASLIEYYMFDDNIQNDSLVPVLIESALKDKASSVTNSLYIKLYDMQYSLALGSLKDAENKLLVLKKYYESNKDGLPKGYDLIPNMAEIELTINR